MIHPGLVSITFRRLTPEQIVPLVSEVGLSGVEWGGDVHVPHGDRARARQVRVLTEDAGLRVSAYGSYYRAAKSEAEGLSFEAVCDTARELGAPTIRVWAGTCDDEEASPAVRAALVADLRRIADVAARAGMTVALEFHRHTLNNSAEASLRLLDAVGHPGLFTFWQPPAGMDVVGCRESLSRVLPRVLNLHVFHWEGDFAKRLPLADGADVWRVYFGIVRRTDREHFASLEYVRGDDPEALREDARALRDLVRTEPEEGRS